MYIIISNSLYFRSNLPLVFSISTLYSIATNFSNMLQNIIYIIIKKVLQQKIIQSKKSPKVLHKSHTHAIFS